MSKRATRAKKRQKHVAEWKRTWCRRKCNAPRSKVFRTSRLIWFLLQGADDSQAQNDLVKAVDQLLNNLGPKFSKVSTDLFAKSESNYRVLSVVSRLNATVDEMSARLDEMEAAIKAGNDTATDGG